MACPHLDYRATDGEHSFAEARAFCTVVDELVRPMRAEIRNDRYDMDHADH